MSPVKPGPGVRWSVHPSGQCAPVAFGPRALERRVKCRSFYFDLHLLEDFWLRRKYHHTISSALVYALHEALTMVEEEGIEARWARHHAMATTTWAWVEALSKDTGRPFGIAAAAGARSSTVTAVTLPDELTGDAIVQAVARRGYVIGGGYGRLKSSTIRIGHMGDHTVEGLRRVLDVTAEAIVELLGKST